MLTNSSTPALNIQAMQFYGEHPVEFCADILNLSLDPWQQEASKALVEDHFVAVKSGSGVGKSVWLSAMGFWFLGTKPFSKVPATAPSKHQLEDVLWGEFFNRMSESPMMSELCTWTQTKVAVKGYEPSWLAMARTARVSPDGTIAEGLQGFHESSGSLLFIVDEASGVADAVFPAMEGALSGEQTYAILTGNPTRLSGYFHSIFSDLRMQDLWRKFTVSCYDSSFVKERYLKMMEARYGKDHPIFQIKVLGEFPSADFNTVFSVEDVDHMRNNIGEDRRTGFNPNAPIEIGVDIGRTISKTIACIRQEVKILDWPECGMRGTITDTVEIAEWIIALILTYNPAAVKIDATGIGTGVYDIVHRLYPRITFPVYGNNPPEETKRDRYVNVRAQGYWELRDILRSIIPKFLPTGFLDEIIDIRYKIKGDKMLMESKDEMIRRIGHSPDYVDAAVYAFLDTDLCYGQHNKWMPIVSLAGLNEGLTRANVWDMSAENIPSSSRFGALHAT